jgi:hypothetical protein
VRGPKRKSWKGWKGFRSEWSDLIKKVQQMPPHVDLLVSRLQVEEPIRFGFRKSVGWRKGALTNWRLALPSGRCIHVREYRDIFKIHWDIADPRHNPLRHLMYDTRRLYNSIRLTVIFAITATFVYHPDMLPMILNRLATMVSP